MQLPRCDACVLVDALPLGNNEVTEQRAGSIAVGGDVGQMVEHA